MATFSYEDVISGKTNKKGAISYEEAMGQTPDGYTEEQIAEMRNPNILGRLSDDLTETATSAGTGIVSGLANIGGNVLNLVPYGNDAVEYLGGGSKEERQAAQDSFNKRNDSKIHNISKFGTELASAWKAPGAVAKGVEKLAPYLSKAKPHAERLAEAIRTGGFGEKGRGFINRPAGGAISGATLTALINPESTGTGALAGALLPSAINPALKLGNAASDFAAPFYSKGQDRVIGKMLNNYSGDDVGVVLDRLNNYKPTVLNSLPTTGQVAKNPGMAALERSAATNPQIINDYTKRQAANNKARIDELANASPHKKQSIFFRMEDTTPLYEKAKLTPLIMTDKLTNIFNTPAMKEALTRIETIAKNEQIPFNINQLTGKDVQYINWGLKDLVKHKTPQSQARTKEMDSIEEVRDTFLSEVNKQIPGFEKANKIYAEKSRPVNQADIIHNIIREGRNKVTGKLSPAAFDREFSNKAVQKITGQKTDKLKRVMEPEQLNRIGTVQRDLLNSNYVNTEGKGLGSGLADSFDYGNILNLGGVPNAMRGISLYNLMLNAARGASKGKYRDVKAELSTKLADAMLHPERAAYYMQNAKVSPEASKIAEMLRSISTKTTPPYTSTINNTETN